MMQYLFLNSLLFLFLQHAPCLATFYSQVGQDQYVYEHFFKDRSEKGTFVDIGAYDGIEGSNSCFFEREQGWSGVCIEPQPEAFAKLRKARTCVCVQGALAKTEGKRQFLAIPQYADQLSGFVDTYHPQHLDKIKNCESYFPDKSHIIEVECFTFDAIMKQNGITHINFLSLDTEGSEYEILTSIDWDAYTIDVLAIEDNYHEARITQFLEQKGYKVVTRLYQDLIFQRSGFQ